MRSGDTLGTLAFSERGTGVGFYKPELRAEQHIGSVKVNGRKSFVTSGGHAHVMLILLQAADGDGLDCFAPEREAPGVSFEGAWGRASGNAR
jgi:isovaleryl-CoA dehydrogenase